MPTRATTKPIKEAREVRSSPGSDTRARQTRSSLGAEIIKQRIKQGIYKPGEQLPTLRALSGELNLSLPSLQRAVRQLESERLLESRHGVGIRILEHADCGSTPLFFGFLQPYFTDFSKSLQHYMEEALDNKANMGVIKSTHNDPARERREIERLINSGVHGLLIWPIDGDTNGEFLQEIAQQLPVVFVDRTVEGVQAPSVVLDYRDGAHQIIKSLYERGHRRILVVCDPADISSFNQLKIGVREEATRLGIESELTIHDYPILELIEAAEQNNYSLADQAYEHLAPLINSGHYDALFCPTRQFFSFVFADSNRSHVLKDLLCVTLRTTDSPSQFRPYHQLGVEEWIFPSSAMIVQALDLLQDMALSSRPSKQRILMKIHRAS